MDIYDKTVNDYFEYAKSSILQINQVMKREEDELVDVKSIVFAAMLVYYGLDFLNDIHLAFLKTEFVACDKKVEEVVSEKYILSDEQIDFIRNHCPGTFYEVTATKDLTTNKCKFKRTIYVDGSLDSFELLEGIIHQMNHVINSIHNPVLKKGGYLGSRMGLSFEQFESRKSNEYELEETINKLQTSDIMSEALGFNFYKIDDTGIKTILDTAFDISCEREGNKKEDGVFIDIVRPLYEHAIFGSILVDDRLKGTLNEIKRSFDSSAESGSFGMLLKEFAAISTCDESQTSMHVESAKSLVKKYIDNCNLNI